MAEEKKEPKQQWLGLEYPRVLAMRNADVDGERKGTWTRSYDEAVAVGIAVHECDTRVIDLKDAHGYFADWTDADVANHYDGAAGYAEDVGKDDDAEEYRRKAAIWRCDKDEKSDEERTVYIYTVSYRHPALCSCGYNNPEIPHAFYHLPFAD